MDTETDRVHFVFEKTIDGKSKNSIIYQNDISI